MLKRFFISTLATITGIWISFGLLFFVGLLYALIGAASMSMTDEDTINISDNSILYLDLKGNMTERYKPQNIMYKMQGYNDETFALDEAIAAIRYATYDDRFDGIFINCNGIASAPASLTELKQALQDFKRLSGKWIISYSDTYNQGDYYVTACADSIYVNPIGGVDLHGLSSTTLYFKDLLDKLGVDVQIFKVGTYKSAVEPFMISSMSEANREQQTVYLGDIWNDMVKSISKDRKISPNTINMYADSLILMDNPGLLVSRKLIDGLFYKYEVISSLKELTNVDYDKELNLVTPRQLCASVSDLPDTDERECKIAVYYAYGDIVDTGNTGIVGDKVIKDLEQLTNDDEIGGLVLRVNSGGGSAFASEQIWDALQRFKDTGKLLYVSMGDYAASGGYYISCGADKIYANPNTLTGSIGIFGMVPCVENTLKNKLGVNPEVVSTNENANMSIMTKFTPYQKKQIQKNVERGYELFTYRCAIGRGMDQDSIKAIAEGRVWTGERALKLGLVDEIGTLQDAIHGMAQDLGYEQDYQVIEYPTLKFGFWDIFKEMQDNSIEAAMQQRLGEFYGTYKQIEEIKNMNPLQCRMEKIIIR